MEKLPGSLVYAQFLRTGHPNTEIMLRREGNRLAPFGWDWVIYLDGKPVDRVNASPDAAYDRMDEIAGYKLLDDRPFNLEASLSR